MACSFGLDRGSQGNDTRETPIGQGRAIPECVMETELVK